MTPPTPLNPAELDDKLIAQLERLVPLVDRMADSLRTVLLLSLAVLAWIGAYLHLLHGFSWTTTLFVVGLAALPGLILVRFWTAFEGLKELPKFAAASIDKVTDDVAQNWHAVASGKKDALNLIGQIKNLFSVRTLLNEVGGVLNQTFSIGTLVNPFSILLGVLALVGTGVLLLVAVFLLLIAIV